FIVPANAPGVNIVRNVGIADDPEATHAYLRFDKVRVSSSDLLGEPGEAFVVAQVRLGGGRVHHAMRVIGQAQRALDALCERALSRTTQGGLLAEKQMVQEKIADSWIELEQFRLLVMRTAWRIDKYQDYLRVRKDIAAVKAAMPKVLHDIAARALHVHGSIGVSEEMPFAGYILRSFQMGLADGPTEVHKVTVAKQLLRDYQPSDSLFPGYHRPTAAALAREKYADALATVEQSGEQRCAVRLSGASWSISTVWAPGWMSGILRPDRWKMPCGSPAARRIYCYAFAGAIVNLCCVGHQRNYGK